MQLPQAYPLDIILSKWKSILDPVIASPMAGVSILDVTLINGTNVINHRLGKKMAGWFLVDIQGAAVIYRNAPFNELTLSLSCNAAVSASIGVF